MKKVNNWRGGTEYWAAAAVLVVAAHKFLHSLMDQLGILTSQDIQKFWRTKSKKVENLAAAVFFYESDSNNISMMALPAWKNKFMLKDVMFNV